MHPETIYFIIRWVEIVSSRGIGNSVRNIAALTKNTS